MTDQYAVIGNPISQSKSPMIHGMFAQACSQDLQYSKIEGSLGRFGPTVDEFRAAGGKGLNVTTPFKLDACAYATDLSSRVKLAGAANALRFDGDHVLAENFDGIGLVRDVTHNLKFSLGKKRVLVLGAGGAARGALLPLLEQGPLELVIANRTLQKAYDLASIGAQYGRVRSSSFADLEGLGFDVVFNATSASMRNEYPAVPDSVFSRCILAYEMAYGKGLTPFLQHAKDSGVDQFVDGVGMLAEQAAEAFLWWRGVRPDTKAVIDALHIPLVCSRKTDAARSLAKRQSVVNSGLDRLTNQMQSPW